MKRNKRDITVFCVLSLSLCGWVVWKPLVTKYHYHCMVSDYEAMRRAKRMMSRTTTNFEGIAKVWGRYYRRPAEDYAQHKEALVRLGYLSERDYRLSRLASSSPGAGAFTFAFRSNFPHACFEWGDPLLLMNDSETNPIPSQLFRVWARPVEFEAIGEFVAQQDRKP